MQEEITQAVKRVEWVIEDINSSAAKVAEVILNLVPVLRQDKPEETLQLLNGFSFAWDHDNEKIDAVIRENELETADM